MSDDQIDLTQSVDAAARAFWGNISQTDFDDLDAGKKLQLRDMMIPVVRAATPEILQASGYLGPDYLTKHLPMAVDKEGDGPMPPEHADHFRCWCMDDNCEWTRTLKSAGLLARASEATRAAGYLEKEAGIIDGPLAPYLSTQARTTAMAMRARAKKLMETKSIEEK